MNPDRFSQLHSLLLDFDDIKRILDEMASLATTVADVAMSCSFTMRYDFGVLTVGSSDERARLLDETQYDTNSGPCLDAMRDNQIAHVSAMRTESRWPTYTARALELGLRSSLSFPLGLRGETFGAMNVYSFEDDDIFGVPEWRELELFAAHAAGTLRVAARQVKDTTLLQQMEESLR